MIEKVNWALAENDKEEIASQIHGFKTKWIMMGMNDGREIALKIEARTITLSSRSNKVFLFVAHPIATSIKRKTRKFVYMNNTLKKSTCLFPIIFSWLFTCAQGIASVWNAFHVQSNDLPIVFHIGRNGTGKLIANGFL